MGTNTLVNFDAATRTFLEPRTSSPASASINVNYAQNKTKKVAWFVSNCGAKNNRLEYAHALQKYIDVDIYGTCGTKSCPRHSGDRCLDILAKEYKFYLAFENSNCRDYITEKFYVNGLKYGDVHFSFF